MCEIFIPYVVSVYPKTLMGSHLYHKHQNQQKIANQRRLMLRQAWSKYKFVPQALNKLKVVLQVWNTFKVVPTVLNKSRPAPPVSNICVRLLVHRQFRFVLEHRRTIWGNFNPNNSDLRKYHSGWTTYRTEGHKQGKLKF